MAALVDTNVLVYRFDARFPDRQRVATEILRRGIAEDSIRVPHQAIMEFVAAATRPLGTATPLLAVQDALREAEEMLTPVYRPVSGRDALANGLARRGGVPTVLVRRVSVGVRGALRPY